MFNFSGSGFVIIVFSFTFSYNAFYMPTPVLFYANYCNLLPLWYISIFSAVFNPCFSLVFLLILAEVRRKNAKVTGTSRKYGYLLLAHPSFHLPIWDDKVSDYKNDCC